MPAHRYPPYKAWVVVAIGAIATAVQWIETGVFNASEWATVGLTVANALGVYVTPYAPPSVTPPPPG